MGIYRTVYNWTVKYFRSNKLLSFYKIRSIIREEIRRNKSFNIIVEKSKIPKHTIDNAIHDVVKAYKTCISNIKNRNISHFRLRFKKQPNMVVIEGQSFSKKKNAFCVKALGIMKSKTPIESKKDSRLIFRNGKFLLYIPYEKKYEKKILRREVCALDPGIRTFQTVYSPDSVYHIGSNTSEIESLSQRIEEVKEYEDKRWYKKYTSRLYTKIRNKVKDLHWKTAMFLCKRFDNILLGNMSTRSIVQNPLHKGTKRLSYYLSHYTFWLRLEHMCNKFGCNAHYVDESYTSKTCGGCGELNPQLGSKKIFKCPSCGLIIDRDVNGARNILIKNY